MPDELKIELRLVLEPSYGCGTRSGALTLHADATHGAVTAAVLRCAQAAKTLDLVGWVEAVIGNEELVLAELWREDRYHELITFEPSKREPQLEDRIADALAALAEHA